MMEVGILFVGCLLIAGGIGAIKQHNIGLGISFLIIGFSCLCFVYKEIKKDLSD